MSGGRSGLSLLPGGLMWPILLMPICCGPKVVYERARILEAEGYPIQAYEMYERSAASQTNGTVVDGLRRTGPPAAQRLNELGAAAEREGRVADAWLCYMRALDIEPNHPTLPHTIRSLEASHGNAVSPVRAEWLRYGPRVLSQKVAALIPDRPSVPAVAKPPVAVAVGERKRETQVAAPATPVAKGRPAIRGTSSAVVPSNRAGVDGASADVPVVEPQPAQAADRQASVRTDPSQVKTGQTTVTTERPESPRPPAKMLLVAPAVESGPTVFAAVRTISKGDRRYPRRVEAVPGLYVRLKDTDDEPEADLDIEDRRGKRVMKLRDIHVGETHGIRGGSGASYDLVLLAINDETETVRFGIRRR